MTGPRRFDPDELGTARAEDLVAAGAMAEWLDLAAADSSLTSVRPSADFADRVMAALADEPSPAPVGFLVPVQRRGLVAGFAESVRQAWASVGGGGRPLLARAGALAYVLAVAIAASSLAGAATLSVAGALGILGPSATETPAPVPTLEPPPPTILPTPSPGPSTLPPTIAPAPTPSESPEGSDDGGGGSGPEPSDDGGGNSGPGSSGDSSGPGRGGGTGSDNSGPGSGSSGSGSGRSSSGSSGSGSGS